MTVSQIRRRLRGAIGAAAFVGAATVPLLAQAPSEPSPVLDELRAIRQLLERLVTQQTPVAQPAGPPDGNPRVTIANLSGFALGRPDAPVTIVEFTDLQCPFCRRYHQTTYQDVVRDYVETGKVRYISLDFPLTAIHPWAQKAARAARCAGEQEAFWEMRHAILANNVDLSEAVFGTLARDLKLDMARFEPCLADTTRYAAELARDAAVAAAARVSGTPSFVVGRLTNAGLEGQLIVGAQPYEPFRARIDELLALR